MAVSSPREACVYISRDMDVEGLVREQINHLDLGSLVRSRNVLIKPNIAHNRPAPITTSADLIRCLITELLKYHPAKVQVGDSGSFPSKHTMGRDMERIYKDSGILDAVKESGGEMISIDENRFLEVTGKEYAIDWKPRVSEAALKADIVINLPVMKTHHMTTVTLGVKNLHGLIPDDQKALHHTEALHLKLTDVFKAAQPDVTIVDGTVAMEGNGPGQGKPVELNTLVGGFDTLAVDAVCCKIMGIEAQKVEHLKLSEKMGLGVLDLDQIEIVGELITRPFVLPDNDVSDISEVVVLKGGVCNICKALLRTSLHGMTRKGIPIRDAAIIIGINPPPPNLRPDTEVILFGECACREDYPSKLKIDSCPPFDGITALMSVLKK